MTLRIDPQDWIAGVKDAYAGLPPRPGSEAGNSRAYASGRFDMRFNGMVGPAEFRTITRAHVIAWRDELVNRALSGMSVRHRLAALSSVFEYLCEKNAVTHNPVKGVKRPQVESYEGKTPALGDHHARASRRARQRLAQR